MPMVQHDVGSEVAVLNGGPIPTTSAYTGNSASTTYTGDTIDRNALGRRYLSATPSVLVRGTFTGSSGLASHSVTATLRMFDSPTSTTWTAYGTSQDGSYSFTATSSGQFFAGLQARFDLSRARRYIRFQYDALTVLAAASSNDVATMAGLAVAFGGAELLPVADVGRITS